MTSATVRTFRARYVFPVTSPPIAGGAVTFDKTIRAVGTHADGDVIDLGNAAIVPGLVNAHTHLELSHFQQPLGDPRHGFPAWIGEMVAWRRAHSPEQMAQRQAASIIKGQQESLAAGVTLLGDIAPLQPPRSLYQEDGQPRQVVFHEVLGLKTLRNAELYQEAVASLQQALPMPQGLSPHAPYTVGVELLEKLVHHSAQTSVPLAMHLAESLDELELLRSHSGAFFALLNEWDAWDPAAIPRGIAVLDYLKLLAQASRALVVHGNYLSAEEIDYLAQHRERLSVVYCPRTHAWFGHPRYPLLEMLQSGVHVALGTDSRASNPDLDLWNELRFVADTYPELSLEAILRLGTVNGAAALGQPQGLLQPGDPASFLIVDLPEEDAADPYELLFDTRSRVREVWSPFSPRKDALSRSEGLH